VYTYLPWHLSTVYTRGAYAEAWLWAFWPWILWAIDRTKEQRLRSTLVGTAAILVLAAATLWTQPGLASLALPLFIAYGVMANTRHRWHWLQLIEALALSLLLLWLAVRRAVETEIPFSDHYLHPFQLLSPTGGDELSFQLGLAAVGLGIVAVALLAGRPRGTPNTKEEREGSDTGQSTSEGTSSPLPPLSRTAWFWGCSLLAIILLCLPVSAWLWDLSRLDALLTYPWQVLALSGLPLALLAGSV
ncbi:MAG: hypothetical protein GWN58_47920, partial [Anaerolineae bacterium]|nr:hypothetical protein [Anaerolineae bacterium]